MAWNEFFMQTTGSNLNAGSTNADSASVTVTNSDWGSVTANRFTASGTPFASVAVGDWASVYTDAATSTSFVAKVTAINGGGSSIDLSTTDKIGTAPSTGATGRSCKINGAWANLIIIPTITAGSPVVSNSTRINVKAGTYSNLSSSRIFSLAGTAVFPVWWRGYKLVPGDQDNNPYAVAGIDIPSWVWTTGQLVVNAPFNTFSNIDIVGGSTTVAGQINANSSSPSTVFYRCRIENTAADVNARAFTSSSNQIILLACYLKANAAADTVIRTGGGSIIGCTVIGGTIGIQVATASENILYTVIDSAAGNAISVLTGLSAHIFNCSIYAPGGHGIAINGTIPASGDTIANCYFENVNQVGKAAIANLSGTNSILIRTISNAFYNCTQNLSGVPENFSIFGIGSIASPAFEAPLNKIFSINSLLEGAAFPGKFEEVSYQGYLDVGAVQRRKIPHYRGRRGT